MKSVLWATVLCAVVAGCATPITPEQVTSAQNAAAQTKAAVAKVQTYTATVCKFLPTAATITALFSAGIGSTIEAVGGAICDAITTAPLADGGQRIAYVKGIRIRGDHLH